MIGFAGRTLGRMCCRSAELCVSNYIGRATTFIPSLSEYEPIASVCFYTGIHGHRSFQLLVEICAVEGSFVRQKTAAELVIGDRVVNMTAIPTNPQGILENIGSRGSVFVSQRDTGIDLVFYRKHLVTKKLVGSLHFNIDRDIISSGFPKSKWYMLRESGHVVGRVKLSFHRIDMKSSMVDCLVLQQALLCAQDYKEQGKMVNTDLSLDGVMFEHEKLYLFSLALEGPLIAKEGGVSEMRYYKAVLSDGAWKWCFWSSKSDCRAEKRPHGSVSILSISTVICHPTDYSCFYLKYYTREGTHDVILKATDRNRDVWCDAVFLFIAETRRYLEHFENFDTLKQYCQT
ncbi:transmembrane protein, putative [Babesia ovis]|uniref:Transmembrane protein, putative n=1 Tax=Babesia ovis TaxID=5869 RepID=A0A9W5WUC5_BABOV|nr:transmembrane protein, putative [Babesia ovis]